MKRYLLDTNICIAILRKEPNMAKVVSQIYIYTNFFVSLYRFKSN